MMKFVFLALILSVKCFAAGEVELVIPSTVEVSPRSQINVYDIVEAKNLTDEVMTALQEIVIPENKVSTITKGELARMLYSVKARFVLPNGLKILKSSGAVSRMEVERKIKNKINADCASCEVQVLISNVPQNIESDWAMDLNIDLSKKNVMIPVYSTKNSNSKGWIVAELKRYKNVPVLNQSVKVGDVLTEEMLTIEKREMLNVRDTYQSMGSLVGMQAIRFLNAGQVVQFSDVKKEQLVKKGQMVKAIVGNNAFEVAITAEVQEGGSAGEVVKVKNLDSQKVFAAKIIERGVVRIE
ncbi:MAG: flagellar protein FlgA [Pseudobdellovibrio sp.]|jgi:flagella basal body P-ring formation protein FlgA|nr:flagellar protein FlgA [Pseudobdellovibrio sp.]